jgi:hypothetical protein
MGYDSPETWKTLSKELDRYHESSIKTRCDLITSRELKEKKRYTDEDDKFICEYVKKNGDNENTWSELAKVFGVANRSVQRRHDSVTDENTCNRGPFTKEEDKLILTEVKLYGNTIETFKSLAINLNRLYPSSIKRRYEFLMNEPSKPPSYWTVEEDKQLIEVLFKVN